MGIQLYSCISFSLSVCLSHFLPLCTCIIYFELFLCYTYLSICCFFLFYYSARLFALLIQLKINIPVKIIFTYLTLFSMCFLIVSCLHEITIKRMSFSFILPFHFFLFFLWIFYCFPSRKKKKNKKNTNYWCKNKLCYSSFDYQSKRRGHFCSLCIVVYTSIFYYSLIKW